VVDPIGAEDERDAGLAPLSRGGAYTRAAAIKVLHELPVAALFGSRGAKVCAVIEAAASLTLEQAVRLAEARHSSASDAQTRAWRRWLDRETTWSRQHSETLQDLDCTLAFAGLRPESPIGKGLIVISGEVDRRAEAISGPSVWVVDEDREERWLAQPWSKASATLLDAALAFGTADLVQNEDANILAAGWREVIGPDPA